MFREDMRQELTRAAVERRTVTYGYLMAKFGMSRGSSDGGTVVGALGEIDKREYQTGAPGFAAIVVRKDTGYPGGGFFCWDGVPAELRRRKEDGQNPELSDAEKRYIKEERERIWSYYRSRYPTHYELGTFTEDH
jgi:hypothetical protein